VACSGATTTTGDTSGNGAAGGRTTAPDPLPGAIAPVSLVRRLSQAELDNTLEDLLGDSTHPAQKFLVEDEFRPYDNDYTVQSPSRSFTDAVREMSRDVARRAASLVAPGTLRFVTPTLGCRSQTVDRQLIAPSGKSCAGYTLKLKLFKRVRQRNIINECG